MVVSVVIVETGEYRRSFVISVRVGRLEWFLEEMWEFSVFLERVRIQGNVDLMFVVFFFFGWRGVRDFKENLNFEFIICNVVKWLVGGSGNLEGLFIIFFGDFFYKLID